MFNEYVPLADALSLKGITWPLFGRGSSLIDTKTLSLVMLARLTLPVPARYLASSRALKAGLELLLKLIRIPSVLMVSAASCRRRNCGVTIALAVIFAI